MKRLQRKSSYPKRRTLLTAVTLPASTRRTSIPKAQTIIPVCDKRRNTGRVAPAP
jgi:hypothetical protein